MARRTRCLLGFFVGISLGGKCWSDASPVQLPAEFRAGRIFLRPITKAGQAMELFTDTGGGLYLNQDSVERLGLELATPPNKPGERTWATLPEFDPKAWIPEVSRTLNRLPISNRYPGESHDGLLGQAFFAGRAWIIDYPRKELWLGGTGRSPDTSTSSRVPIPMLENKEGRRLANYPRIDVSLDGKVIPLLLDTGATVSLTPRAQTALGDQGHPKRATSFLIASHFDRLAVAHPSWRVIPYADSTTHPPEPILRVPSVEVAGFSTGPIWFTRRADHNFRKWMSQWTDRPIDGALGGNALQTFRVHLDYIRSEAVFEQRPK